MSSPEALAFGLEISQGIGLRSITRHVKYSDLKSTGVTASGYLTFVTRLPAYSLPIGCKIRTIIGFAGDTTAVMGVGLANIATPTGISNATTGCIDYDVISGSATYSVLTAGLNYAKWADVASAYVDTQGSDQIASPTVANENYIMVVVTSGSDWTKLTAGEAVVSVYYFNTLEGYGEAPGVGMNSQ